MSRVNSASARSSSSPNRFPSQANDRPQPCQTGDDAVGGVTVTEIVAALQGEIACVSASARVVKVVAGNNFMVTYIYISDMVNVRVQDLPFTLQLSCSILKTTGLLAQRTIVKMIV